MEVVSDSGEGARKCGRIFNAASAGMRNGVSTVETIPGELQPPPRTAEGASGNRIRFGPGQTTSRVDETNLVALNEQVLLGRHRLGALASDAPILLENSWATDPNPDIRAAWDKALVELSAHGYRIIAVPMWSGPQPTSTSASRCRPTGRRRRSS